MMLLAVMLRLLLVWLVLALAVGAWRSWRRGAQTQQLRRRSTQAAVPQPMVACAHCGVLLPRSEALARGGAFYCCIQHRDQHDT